MNATIDDLLPRAPVRTGPPAPTAGTEDGESPTATGRRTPPAGATVGTLTVTVVWGDLTRTAADIHVTGHYAGVMPSAAEKGLDLAISRPGSEGVIAGHTRRRFLNGLLGELSYFPARGVVEGSPLTVVRAAVAGMGRVGTFTQANAARLYQSLVRELDGLGYIRRAATVAIGAGAGNLAMRQLATAMLQGARAAFEESADGGPRSLQELLVVEFDRMRAEALHRALTDAVHPGDPFTVTDHIAGSAGGRLGPDAAAVYAIRAILARLSAPPDAEVGDPAATLLAGVPDDLRDEVGRRLIELAPRPSDVTAVTIAALAQSRDGEAPPDDGVPTRVSVLQSPTGLVWSAQSARATVPEREVSVNTTLLSNLTQRLTGPSEADAADLPPFFTRFLVPLDLQRQLTADAPLIIEVEPATAGVPWEFLMSTTDTPEGAREPLAVRQCLARQLRTSYARTDVEEPSADRLLALVVGDPAGGKDALPQARAEALAVAQVLSDHDVTVDLFVGAPGDEPPPGARCATRLDVLARLLTQHYDVVHYAGHGVFDARRPQLSGWLFSDGVLAARELTQISAAPRLVVANACWSAARPPADGKPGNDQPSGPGPGDSGRLAPVLADEFFRVGVGHFIGATWAIPDVEAKLFAERLYSELLPDADGHWMTVGQAVRSARRELWTRGAEAPDGTAHQRRTAWAAYQHYGDPTDHLIPPTGHDPEETST